MNDNERIVWTMQQMNSMNYGEIRKLFNNTDITMAFSTPADFPEVVERIEVPARIINGYDDRITAGTSPMWIRAGAGEQNPDAPADTVLFPTSQPGLKHLRLSNGMHVSGWIVHELPDAITLDVPGWGDALFNRAYIMWMR